MKGAYVYVYTRVCACVCVSMHVGAVFQPCGGYCLSGPSTGCV